MYGKRWKSVVLRITWFYTDIRKMLAHTKIFAGFISLCTTPRICRYWRAFAAKNIVQNGMKLVIFDCSNNRYVTQTISSRTLPPNKDKQYSCMCYYFPIRRQLMLLWISTNTWSRNFKLTISFVFIPKLWQHYFSLILSDSFANTNIHVQFIFVHRHGIVLFTLH